MSLKAYSQAYILMTLIPLITSFITLILLSAILEALTLQNNSTLLTYNHCQKSNLSFVKNFKTVE